MKEDNVKKKNISTNYLKMFQKHVNNYCFTYNCMIREKIWYEEKKKSLQHEIKVLKIFVPQLQTSIDGLTKRES